VDSATRFARASIGTPLPAGNRHAVKLRALHRVKQRNSLTLAQFAFPLNKSRAYLPIGRHENLAIRPFPVDLKDPVSIGWQFQHVADDRRQIALGTGRSKAADD